MGLNLVYDYGQTPLDVNETEGLLIKLIVANQKDLNEYEQNNILKAAEWLDTEIFSPDIVLSESFIKYLHKQMYGEVWSWAGKFRKSEKNIGVNSIYIGTDLRQLFDDVNYWIENKVFTHDEI